jgi:tight adherence protein B
MLVAMVVFVVVVGGVVGAYMAFSASPGAIKQRQLEQRLREISEPIEQQHAAATSVLLNAKSDALFERLAHGTRGGAHLAKLIEQSGVKTTPGTVVVVSIGAAAVFAVVAMVLVRQMWILPMAASVGLILPTWLLTRKRSMRMRKFEELFPEALDLLSRAVKAGHAFQTAMNMAADELPDPVGPEFRKTFDQQNFGLPLRDALNAMSERVPIIDVKFFVTAVLIQRETGGNLSEILDNLSHVVRERFKVLRQVRVHTAHGRFTGWVLLALPAFVGVAMMQINPEHMQLLYKEPMGQKMLITALGMQITGYLWIKKVIKIEV